MFKIISIKEYDSELIELTKSLEMPLLPNTHLKNKKELIERQVLKTRKVIDKKGV